MMRAASLVCCDLLRHQVILVLCAISAKVMHHRVQMRGVLCRVFNSNDSIATSGNDNSSAMTFAQS